MPSESVFALVLNWNGKKETLQSLSALEKSETKGFTLSIVVVDNGSTDNSAQEIRKRFPGVSLLRNAENKGFAAGNNQGIKYAEKRGADYIFLVNNDAFVEKETVKELLAGLQRHPKAAMASPKIYFEKDGKKMIWYAGGEIDWANIYGRHVGVDTIDHGQYDKEVQTGFCTGCAVMIRASALKKTGFFDERFFAYYEDSDLSVRAKKAGFELWYVPTAIVFHKNAASGGGVGNRLQDYFIPRNRLLFAFKHAPLRTKLALLRESFRLVFTPRRQGVFDFFFLRFGKGRCGFV